MNIYEYLESVKLLSEDDDLGAVGYQLEQKLKNSDVGRSELVRWLGLVGPAWVKAGYVTLASVIETAILASLPGAIELALSVLETRNATLPFLVAAQRLRHARRPTIAERKRGLAVLIPWIETAKSDEVRLVAPTIGALASEDHYPWMVKQFESGSSDLVNGLGFGLLYRAWSDPIQGESTRALFEAGLHRQELVWPLATIVPVDKLGLFASTVSSMAVNVDGVLVASCVEAGRELVFRFHDRAIQSLLKALGDRGHEFVALMVLFGKSRNSK